MDTWIKDYLLLCLRIDAALAQKEVNGFVDSYYGPPELKEQALAGAPQPLAEHIPAARSLLDRLPGQGFEPQRAAYLEKQVRALETISRIFSGQEMSLEERLRGCLDVPPAPAPEDKFDQALKLYDAALPGKGDLRQRYAKWRERNELPPEKTPLAAELMDRVLAEARRRTQAIAPLPEGESLDLYPVSDKTYGAANWYLGGYRSRLELNVRRPVNLSGLLYQMCHEGYPGHHTEYTLKEAHLYRQRGYLEMGIYILSPQLVISEGIATLACDMVFDAQEAAQWAAEQLYAPLGIPVADVDLEAIYRAASIAGGDDLGGNVVLLMEQGYDQDQLFEYVMSRTLYPENQVREWLQSLQEPLSQIYAFSYFQGARLMEPLLQGDQRIPVFRRFLTEQVYPSQLELGGCFPD